MLLISSQTQCVKNAGNAYMSVNLVITNLDIGFLPQHMDDLIVVGV